MRWLILTLLLNQYSLADTVKITSRSLMQEARGSGWSFLLGDQTYVITSEHLLIPDGAVEVNLPSGPIPAETIWSDWAKGLALLKVSKSVPAKALKGTDEVKVGDEVRVVGFPFDQFDRPLEASGIVSVTQSDRPFLAAISGIELIQSHGEYGMSGGPVLSKSGELVGLLSHQILQIIPGDRSGADQLKPGKSPAENLFIIPYSEIVRALSQAQPTFERLSQSDEDLTLKYGSYRFTLDPRVQIAILLSGGNGVGIGGGSHESARVVEVERIGGASDLDYEQFPNKKTFWVIGFVTRKESSYQRVNFSSMEEFVRLLLDKKMLPLTRLESESATKSKLQDLANNALLVLSHIEGNLKGDLNLDSQLKVCLELLKEDYGQAVVKPSELVNFLKGEEFNSDWKEFTFVAFEDSVTLMQLISQIEDQL